MIYEISEKRKTGVHKEQTTSYPSLPAIPALESLHYR
jgi:hypothetical protein